ncbi:MAG: Uncharacterised protein [Prochlorococcus marinus str. MIT 9215]|nr:MAG: Uncharacterised protein [Prochlorococcus marinus str. MIT 9215]
MKSVIAIDSLKKITNLLVCGLLLSSFGCTSRSAPSKQASEANISSQACLDNLDLEGLEHALKHCNKVVQQHQNNPEPLNDRSLIYTLMGQTNLACQDVSKALALLQDQGQAADQMVLHELNARQSSCKQRLNMAGNG